MKAPSVLVGATLAVLLVGAGALRAQYNVIPTPVTPSAPPPSGNKDAGKSEPEEGKIVGLPIARQNGHWLGLAIEEGNFKLRFYDQHKKPEKPDVARATARWSPVGIKSADLHTVLNPEGDGMVLRGPQFVAPPLTFKVFLTLLSTDDKVVETFVVDAPGP